LMRFRQPGRYQELDLFIKVLRLLCPNLTDASSKDKSHFEGEVTRNLLEKLWVLAFRIY
jgi:hypothetical protein